MTTFALVHGSGDGGWAWQRVRRVASDRLGIDAGHCPYLSRSAELAGLLVDLLARGR